MPKPAEAPEGLSDEEKEAYERGFDDAMRMVATAAAAWAASVRAPEEPPEQDDEEEDEHDTCEECGGRKIHGFGREDKFCPSCDLPQE